MDDGRGSNAKAGHLQLRKKALTRQTAKSAPTGACAPSVKVLDDECVAFSHYLVRQRPGDYVLGKYREAHATGDLFRGRASSYFDQFLLRAAMRHPLAARLIDSYTAVFFKRSTVRTKWVLLLAILESCAPTYRYFDAPDSSGRWSLALGMLGQGAVFSLTLGLSVLLFLPLQLACGAWAQLSRRSE